MGPVSIDDTCRAPITTQIEFTMMMIMGRITDKLGWEEKVCNEDITNKWRAELVNFDGDSQSLNNIDAEDHGGDEGEQKDQANIEKAGRIMPEETMHKEVENDETDWLDVGIITNKMVDWVSIQSPPPLRARYIIPTLMCNVFTLLFSQGRDRFMFAFDDVDMKSLSLL